MAARVKDRAGMMNTLWKTGALVGTLLLLSLVSCGEGGAAFTIVVDSTADTDSRDGVVTLREAILLATDGLALADLDAAEAKNVSGLPGAASADVIGFDSAVFPPSQPATIVLTDTLPSLSSGNDAIEGSGAGVIIDGDKKGLPCLVIESSGNAVRGLQIENCHTAIWLKPTADNNIVGGSKEGQGNVLSSNRNVGIEIDGSANVVQGNYAGTDPTGTEARPNGIEGIWITPGATDNLIGGSSPGEGNVISGNDLYGLGIAGTGATGNVVKGNLIGVDVSGEKALRNRYGLVLSLGAQGNTIGGTSPGDANVMSGNQDAGMLIRGPDTSNNLIVGNYIGTDASGQESLGNGTGIWVLDGAVSNTIGGIGAGEGNVIAHNGIDGVLVQGTDTRGNTIRGNSIYSSGREGIFLEEEGNANLPAPTFTGVSPVSGTACSSCIVDIYSDSAGEGRIHEGWTTADGDGHFSFEGSFAEPFITATATDAEGNTSPFSVPRPVRAG
jgi:hypothetical protein